MTMNLQSDNAINTSRRPCQTHKRCRLRAPSPKTIVAAALWPAPHCTATAHARLPHTCMRSMCGGAHLASVMACSCAIASRCLALDIDPTANHAVRLRHVPACIPSEFRRFRQHGKRHSRRGQRADAVAQCKRPNRGCIAASTITRLLCALPQCEHPPGPATCQEHCCSGVV